MSDPQYGPPVMMEDQIRLAAEILVIPRESLTGYILIGVTPAGLLHASSAVSSPVILEVLGEIIASLAHSLQHGIDMQAESVITVE